MGGHLHQWGPGRAGRGGPAETVHSLPHLSVENEEEPQVEVKGWQKYLWAVEKIKPTDDPRVHSFAAGALESASAHPPFGRDSIAVTGWVGTWHGQVSGTLVQR